MNFTNRAEKADKKCGYLSSSHASFLDLRSLHTLSKKKLYFLQFCADLSQKGMRVKAIYIYGSEKVFQKMIWLIGV